MAEGRGAEVLLPYNDRAELSIPRQAVGHRAEAVFFAEGLVVRRVYLNIVD